MRKNLVCTLLLILLTAGFSKAQSYYFKHYQVENGLSNNSILCSLKDKKGFLWFGTKDGLNRFDGYSFKIFRYDPRRKNSIGDDLVLSLYEDDHQKLWVGTDKGIYIFDPLTEKFTFLKGTPVAPIYDMDKDGSGNMWFIGRSELFRYSVRESKLVSFEPSRYFAAKTITIDKTGLPWIAATDGTLRVYNPKAGNFTAFDLLEKKSSVTSRSITALCWLENDKLLVGTQASGAYSFDVTTKKFKPLLTSNPDGSEIFVNAIIKKSANEFWIGSETGLYIYNTASEKIINLQKEYNNPYSLTDNSINTFCLDNEGGLWVGTYYGGLNYFPSQYFSFEKFFPKSGQNSISGNIVGTIVADPRGKLWIGTEDGGLNRLDPATGIFKPYRLAANGIAYKNIRGLGISSDTLWVGTYAHGLCMYNVSTGKIIGQFTTANNPALSSNYISHIYRRQNGEMLFCTSNGIYRYNASTKQLQLFGLLPNNLFYTSVIEDRNGILWIGTFRRGLYRYNVKTGEIHNYRNNRNDKNSIGSDRVNAIFEDSRNNIWVGTDKGLSLFRAKTTDFKVFTHRYGFPSDLFCSITEDSRNVLWVGTSKGLAEFNPSTEVVRVYTRQAGVLSNQFNYNSVYKSASGQLYFGGLRGLIRFKPSTFRKSMYKPPLYITNFFVHNRPLKVTNDGPLKMPVIFADTVRLDHTESTFSLEFAAISYTSGNSIQYAYRLDKLDKTWNFLRNNRKAYFTKVSPGKYTFRLKATNSAGLWMNEEKRLIIIIEPPWWRTTIAYTVYLLLFGALIYYFYYLLLKRNKLKHQKQLEQMEATREKEINKARIEYFTQVAHEIRTPLTLISGPMENILDDAEQYPKVKKNLKIMDQNVQRLLDLTNQLLDFRKSEIKGFSLQIIEANIADVLSKQVARFRPLAEKKKLDLYIDLDHSCVAEVDVEALNKIVSNLFNNAIKYAESSVYLSLVKTPDNFEIEFKNDGYLIPKEMREKVFETFFRLKETRQQSGSGIGLALARSLAELHHGTLDLHFSNPGFNTFMLIMPLRQVNS